MTSKTEKRRYGSGVRPYVIRSAVEERSVVIIWDMLGEVEGERGSRDREVRQVVTAKGPRTTA